MSPDPRSAVVERDGAVWLAGVRCRRCAYPVAGARPRCPVCGGPVAAAEFGPEGTVWAATVVHVAVPGRTPPYGLAYVDLDDGPRVLAHAPERTAVGIRVRLAPKTAAGDLAVMPA